MKRAFLSLSLLLVGHADGRVILLSMDGLRPDAITVHGPENVPNFYRLRTEGAFTDEARTDFDYSTTLPNHVSMVTGRPVLGTRGHQLKINSGGAATPLHTRGYIPGMFDVAHDHGFSTALIATKSKFGIFDGNYGPDLGAPDVTGEDHGRDKIDFYQHASTDAAATELFLTEMANEFWDLTMIHLATLDSVGHGRDWNLTPGSAYMEAVKVMDSYLGQILTLIDETPELSGSTHLILTTDHGGTAGTKTHVFPEVPTNYTIPFYVWGPDVKAGADLYELNPDYQNPRGTRPVLDAPYPAIRNGFAGNLALQLLELPAIPGSSLNASQQLRVNDALGFSALYPDLDPGDDANENGFSNFHDYALGAHPESTSLAQLPPRMNGKTLTVRRRMNSTDFVMGIEISPNLEDWYPLYEGVTYVVESSRETPEGRTYQLRMPTLLDRVFFRQTFSKIENPN